MAKVRQNIRVVGLRLIFHSVGIGCLVGAVFLQVLVFLGIATRGFFIGIETNPFILNIEVALSIFCVIYLLYLFISRKVHFS